MSGARSTEGSVRPGTLSSGSPLRRWLPWALLAVVAATALSVAAFGTREAPTAQDRVVNIAKTIKCPTCAGESVAESNALVSQEIRLDIAERIQQGQSDAEIRAYYGSGSRYNQNLLLSPPTTGISVLVWILPVLALAVAVGALVVVFRRWSTDPTAQATDADRALVAEALRREHAEAGPVDDPHGEGGSR